MVIILSNSPWSASNIYFNGFFFVPARFPWHINCSPKCSIFWALWLIFFVLSVHHYWSIKHTLNLCFFFSPYPRFNYICWRCTFFSPSKWAHFLALSFHVHTTCHLSSCVTVEGFFLLSCERSSTWTCGRGLTLLRHRDASPPPMVYYHWFSQCRSRCLQCEDEESIPLPAACVGVSN